MPESGRLTAVLEDLQSRLERARATVRSNPRSVDELLRGGEQDSRERSEAGDHLPETDAQPDGPRDGRADGQVEPSGTNERVDSGDRADADPSVDDQARPARCTVCGKAIERAASGRASLCADCLTSGGEVSQPTTQWKDATLSELSEAILQVLVEAYPEQLTAPDIVERLSAHGRGAGDADKSAVNSKLYGPLDKWLEKEGQTPPYWSLEEAQREKSDTPTSAPQDEDSSLVCTLCGRSLQQPQYVAGSGVICQRCASRQRKAKADTTGRTNKSEAPREEEHQGTSSERAAGMVDGAQSDPGDGSSSGGVLESDGESYPLPENREQQEAGEEAPETADGYELCYMCITEHPETELTRHQGMRLCLGCLEDVRGDDRD